MGDDLKFRHPFLCIVSGTSCSGKTLFCIRFRQKIDYLCTERIYGGGIVWCYDERSAVPPHQQLPANINFDEGILDDFGNAHGERRLLIRRELLNEVYSKQVCELFTRGSHHRISA